MIITCAFCGKQVIDGHDCPERRALLANATASVAIQDGKMIYVSLDPGPSPGPNIDRSDHEDQDV